MDDSTFDELFSDKLREEQEFDYRDEDWTELSDRLEKQPKRRWGWLYLVAGLFMAASIATNIWQAWSLQKVQGEISALQEEVLEQTQTIKSLHLKHERQLSEQVLASNQFSVQRDTIYKTIYKTIIQEKEVPVYIYPENSLTPKSGDLSNTKNSAAPAATNSIDNTSKTNKTSLLNAETTTPNALGKSTFLSQLTSLPLHLLPTIDRALAFSFPEDYEKTEDVLIQPAFKKKWRLGPSVAYSRVPNNCFNQNNQHFGLDLNVDLSRRWTLESSYSYNRISNICLVNQPVDTNGIYVPSTNVIIDQDDTNYALSRIQNIRSKQRYLQISLGAKHHFSKRFYAGVHILGYHFLQREIAINAKVNNSNQEMASPLSDTPEQILGNYDINYNFLGFNNLDGMYAVRERSKPGLIIDRMEITAGTTFTLKNKYQIPVELFYQSNLNLAQYSLPPLVGLRASFLFKL